MHITSNERIMVYGGTGCGKSDGWLSIAEVCPDDMFYCIDTDKAIKRMLDTEYGNLKNVKVVDCRNWETFEKAVERISELIKDRPGDWVIVDMIDALWSFVQNWYTQKVFGKDYDEYMLQVRQAVKDKDPKKLETLKGWTDWNVINPTYQDAINRMFYEFDCNIYVTAKSVQYSSSSDDKDYADMKEMFASVGLKPEGEKRNPNRTHTVLFFNNDFDGYYVTTIKDRGRPKLRHFKYSSDANRHKLIDVYGKIITKQEVKEID